MKLISIIIPAYNEEERISKTLQILTEFTQSSQNMYTFELIVVSDGSSDSTVKLAKTFNNVKVLEQNPNKGKGAAVGKGMLAANGDFLLFTDADLSTPITEIFKLLNKLENEGYDIAIGSRAINSSLIKERQPFYREFMGKTFNRFVRFFVVKGISDTQCGFKLFSQAAAKKLFSLAKIEGFSFDVEIIFLAKKFNYKIAEVPVLWFNDNRSKVNPIIDSVKMLRGILNIKKLHKYTSFTD